MKNKKDKNKINKNLEWNEADIKHLPFNLILVLNFFIKKNKLFLDSTEITKGLNLKEKQIGAIMSAFGKTAKGRPPLIFPIFRIGRQHRWVIRKEFLPLVKRVMSELKPYLEENG